MSSSQPAEASVGPSDLATSGPDPSALSFRCERAIWVLRDRFGHLWLAPGVPAPHGEPGGVMPDIAPSGTYAESSGQAGSPTHEIGGGVMPDGELNVSGAEDSGQSQQPPGDGGGVMPDRELSVTGVEGSAQAGPPAVTGEGDRAEVETGGTFLLVPATPVWRARAVRVYALDDALLPAAFSVSAGMPPTAGER